MYGVPWRSCTHSWFPPWACRPEDRHPGACSVREAQPSPCVQTSMMSGQIYIELPPHMGKGGGCTPPEGQKQVPYPVTEKWVPITKNSWSFLLYTPFSWPFLLCMSLLPIKLSSWNSYKMTEKTTFILQQAIFFFYVKIFLSSPLPPLFTQAMAAKNITSPIAIFDPCTHEKNFFTPSMKKVVPMCGYP